jgi:hypothetical protein
VFDQHQLYLHECLGKADWRFLEVSDSGNTVLVAGTGTPFYFSVSGGTDDVWFKDVSVNLQDWHAAVMGEQSAVVATVQGTLYRFSVNLPTHLACVICLLHLVPHPCEIGIGTLGRPHLGGEQEEIGPPRGLCQLRGPCRRP